MLVRRNQYTDVTLQKPINITDEVRNYIASVRKERIVRDL